MSDFFKTNELSKDELIVIYERINKDYQKETQDNAQLKKDIKFYKSEIERLEKLISYFKKNR
ncbi:hypothetical protein [Flavobacterium oreochromis]|uniref:Uncharacterized protein n=1 Tax=Flavobacterium columnare TaxID=996 RepID=A0A246G9W6_9FLAO|nr:hypothetical protein [Flavobacterium oreochromis]OWP76554.1 hypothetical protein BWK62_09460 [Flavobacterium oreochromis]